MSATDAIDASSDDTHGRAWRTVAAWVLLGFALRTMLGALVPLFPDETYYWEWSRHLAAGYFDHPPAIAYLIAAGTALFGDSVLAVRFGAALAALVTHVGAVLLAVRLGGHAAGVRAAVLVTVIPLASLGLVLATPDAPLLACTTLTLLCTERALAAPLRSARATRWWLAAGVALGAAFLSKYTAILVPLALLVALVVHPALRARLREPGPYLASIVAAMVFLPVLLWNASNDWISFRFQLGHGLGTGAKGSVLTRELELIGGQLGLATPILAVLAAIAVGRALRARRQAAEVTHLDVRRFAMAMLAVVPLAFFAFSATRRAVEANWPALAYPAAIVLLASGTAPIVRGAWWRRGIALAAVLLGIACLQAWRPVLPLAPRKDPIARAFGWDRLALAVDSARRDPFVAEARTTWIAAERYQDASEIAWHLADRHFVFSLNLAGRANQYDLWPTPYGSIRDGDALVAAFDANPEGDERARRVAGWFAEVQEGEVIALRRGDGEVAHRKVWRFRGAHAVPTANPTRDDRR